METTIVQDVPDINSVDVSGVSLRKQALEAGFAGSAIGSLVGHLKRFLDPAPYMLKTPYAPDEPQVYKDAFAELINELDKTSSLYSFEVSQQKKFEPLTPLDPWNMVGPDKLEEIRQTSRNTIYTHLPSEYDDTLVSMRKLIRPGSLHLWTHENALKAMDLNTNSGYPYFTGRRDVAELELNASKSFKVIGDVPSTYVMGARASGAGDFRIVWMAPMSANISQKRVVGPLTEALRDSGFMATWGGIPVLDRAVQRTLSYAKSEGKAVLSFDESGFDRHVNYRVNQDVESLMLSWFNLGESEGVMKSFVLPETRLVMPGFTLSQWDGYLARFQMYSGHGGTNLLDSLINVTKINTVIRYITGENLVEQVLKGLPVLQVNGDDAVFVVPKTFETQLDELATVYDQMFGAVVHPDKQLLSDSAAIMNSRLTDLSYYNGMVSVAPIHRRQKLFWPERPIALSKHDGKLISTAELYAIAAIERLETLNTHPLFRKVVKYISQLDQYQLYRGDENLIKVSKRAAKLKSVRTFLDVFDGSGRTGAISENYETVRVLRELYGNS